MAFEPDELTTDAFLGGRVMLGQPKKGFRAGVDSVLLAAAVGAKPGQGVLELGCGAGAAMFCLATRVHSLDIVGVEFQRDYADLARRNAETNKFGIAVVEADIRNLPETLRNRTFDHVMANPPYYEGSKITSARDAGRRSALTEAVELRDWTEVATRRLAPGGYLTMIQKADRLPDMLAALDKRLGSLCVQPISPRESRKAELVILQARKGGKGAFSLRAPLVMHQGPRHEADKNDYSEEAENILRHAAPLNFNN